MNWETIQGNWKQVTGKAKEQWGKLTAEVAVGLAILVSVFRNLGTIDVGNLKNLKG